MSAGPEGIGQGARQPQKILRRQDIKIAAPPAPESWAAYCSRLDQVKTVVNVYLCSVPIPSPLACPGGSMVGKAVRPKKTS